jgi:PAS domain S-box-containing protein
MSWTNKPIFGEDGAITEILAVGSDITELKQAEEAAWVASQNLQSILNNAKGFFIYQAVPDETYTYGARVLMVSPSVTDVSGMTDVYNFGAWFENIHPDDLPRIVEANRHSIETHGTFNEVMRWHHRLRNEWIWMHVISNPVYDQLGRIMHFNGLFIDITAQKKAEEALQRERDLLQTIMDSAGKAQLVYLDRDFNLVQVNETYATGCGYRPEEMIGKNHFALYPSPEVEAIFSHVRDTGEDFEVHDRPFEYPDQPERGVTYWDWTLKAIKDPGGQVTGLVFSLYDTTERKRAEEELLTANDELEFRVQERTAQLRKQADLLDLPHDAVILNDKEGTISFWNKGAEETYGFTREEAVGKSLHALLQTRSDIPRKDIMGSVKNEGRWEGELVHTRKDGKKVTVHSRWALRHNEVTGSSEIMEVNRDITQRKRAEKALAMMSAYNRSLIEASIDPLVTINSQGMISDVNIATERVTGYPRDKLIGTDFCDYFTDPTKAKAVYEQVFRKETVRDYELEILRKDGRTTPVLYNASVYRDEAGKVAGVFAAARDITERRHMEQILRESEERYRVAIESASDGVALMRGDQHIYVNKRFAEMFGYSSPSEILGKPHSLTVHPDDLAMVSQINMMRQNGEPVPSRYEFRGIRKDGSQRNIEVSATLVNYRQEPVSLVYLRDITDYKNLEEQLRQAQKMEAIGTLAGGIAHDFNNILAAIIGFTEMVEEDLPPESPSIPRLKRALSAASRGKELVRQILAFSRKTELERKPLSLSSVIHETFQFLRASLPTTIEMNLNAKATRDAILASPTEVQQILMNLATNAFFAMREKGGVLSIGTIDIDFEPDSPVLDTDVEPGEYVQLVVADTGHGMEHHVMQRVFEPFFTTKGVGEGTGMGLAVVYGIVKSLHGTIAVESEPGKGSAFRICLPVARTDEKRESIDVKVTPRGTEHILFVDDEELLVEWAQAALERLGYTVTALTDSMEALKLFSVDPSRFDLVITDQTMPKLTGLHLARKLLMIRTNIPIILCTGHSDSVSPKKTREAGIGDFLMKPLGKQQLAEAIRRVLNTTESEN